MTMRLEGKVAAVTGGGAGIGEAICHRLAAEGARVAALDISLPAARQVIEAIGDGLAAEVDVSDSAAVDAVAPGFVDTSRLEGALDTGRQAIAARAPAGRLGTSAEIAATVAFLASDDAAYFVGATLSPNGGLVTAV